jgi:hypothetical protein
VKPSRKEILELQAAVLRAALEGKPLPGSDRPFHFPDLALLQQQDSIYVAGEGNAARAKAAAPSKPVRFVSPKSVPERTPYLRFGRARLGADSVELTLEGRIASQDPKQPSLGLSGVRVSFRRVRGKWVLAGDPVVFAS